VEGRDELVAIFQAALERVHAGRAVERALPEFADDAANWQVLAVGKAATPMARAAAGLLGSRVARGLIVTKQGYGEHVPGFELREAAHPVPDARAVASAEVALEQARTAGEGGALLVLLSGGASALLAAPAEGLTLDDKRTVTAAMLASGLDIGRVNQVRRHLSRIKGGWLAQAASRARIVTLAVSDVAGDSPEAIGSGPTAPDPSRFEDALDALRAPASSELVPAAVVAHLEGGVAGRHAETPKPGAECFERAEYRVIASLDAALDAAVEAGRAMGLRVHSLGRVLDRDVGECAGLLASAVSEARSAGADLLVAGGEPTVVLTGSGKGGRAQQLAVEFALAVDGPFAALFAGSDGTDGPTDAAGALVDAATLSLSRALGLDPRVAVLCNDTHPLLAAAEALFVTGPTHTNVTDLALILLNPGTSARQTNADMR
jgi:glycerate-2-kinase